jgi:hypothetical protein
MNTLKTVNSSNGCGTTTQPQHRQGIAKSISTESTSPTTHDHVMSWKEEGPRWGDAPDRPSMMGLYLRQVYGKDLYIIAMSSATTSAGLPTAKSIDRDSIDRVLTDIGPPLMVLDVRSGQGNREARDWLSTERSMNANINIDFRLTPATAVDAFSFVKTLTPSIQPASGPEGIVSTPSTN